jgi:hypothetical protein
MEHHIEVIVTKMKTRFKAICPLFPECKGIGSTEEKALLDLSKQMSKQISKMVEDNLGGLLTSTRYTEVLLDITSPQKQQRRVFHTQNLMRAPNMVDLKVKVNLSETKAILKKNNELDRILNEMEEIIISDAFPGRQTQEMDVYSDPQAEEDVFGFGVPMSFN